MGAYIYSQMAWWSDSSIVQHFCVILSENENSGKVWITLHMYVFPLLIWKKIKEI